MWNLLMCVKYCLLMRVKYCLRMCVWNVVLSCVCEILSRHVCVKYCLLLCVWNIVFSCVCEILSCLVCVKCHQSSHSFIEFNGWLRSMSDSSVFFLVIFFYFGNVKFLSRKWNYVLHFNTHKKITKSNHQQLIDFFMIRFLSFWMTVLKNIFLWVLKCRT